jgi:hypothetical protein
MYIKKWIFLISYQNRNLSMFSFFKMF